MERKKTDGAVDGKENGKKCLASYDVIQRSAPETKNRTLLVENRDNSSC